LSSHSPVASTSAGPDDIGLRVSTPSRPPYGRLLYASCSSGRDFACSFLRTLPRGRALAVRLEVPVIKVSKGLSPSSHFPVGFRLPVPRRHHPAPCHPSHPEPRPVAPAGALSDPDKEISTIRLFRRERLRESPRSGRESRASAAGSPAAGRGSASRSSTHAGSAGSATCAKPSGERAGTLAFAGERACVRTSMPSGSGPNPGGCDRGGGRVRGRTRMISAENVGSAVVGRGLRRLRHQAPAPSRGASRAIPADFTRDQARGIARSIASHLAIRRGGSRGTARLHAPYGRGSRAIKSVGCLDQAGDSAPWSSLYHEVGRVGSREQTKWIARSDRSSRPIPRRFTRQKTGRIARSTATTRPIN